MTLLEEAQNRGTGIGIGIGIVMEKGWRVYIYRERERLVGEKY